MTIVFLTSCDPGYGGDLKIFNESSTTLNIKYCDHGPADNFCDTLTLDIQPYSSGTLRIFQTRGRAKKFDCCPCEVMFMSFKSPLGPIKKDATNKDNWLIPNKNKLKNNGTADVKCEFHVTQSDL